MLVARWGILRKPLPAKMGLSKLTSLVMSLCRLHNYCIDERERLKETDRLVIPPSILEDQAEIATHGGIPLVERPGNALSPDQLLHGGEHFDEFTRSTRRRLERQARLDANLDGDQDLPREELLHQVIAKGVRRPTPVIW